MVAACVLLLSFASSGAVSAACKPYEYVAKGWEKSISDPKAYIISSRGDRYGANSSLWMAAMLLSFHKQIPLYHVCHPQSCFGRWGHTVYHTILVDSCVKGMPPRGSALLNTTFFPSILHTCCEALHSDIPSALHRSCLKAKWFAYFERQARKEGWSLRWDPSEAIVVHVRLEDCAPSRGREGCPTGKKTGKKLLQGYIGDSNLKALLTRLHERFPKKEIYLMTSPLDRDLARCGALVKDFSFVKGVFGDNNLDYTLWQMMRSDILVLSRSTFSMVAGLLHQGSHCFTCENWTHLEDMLGKEDQGKWECFSL